MLKQVKPCYTTIFSVKKSRVFSQVNYFLMFYKEGYRPVTYDKCQVDVHPYPFQRSLAWVKMKISLNGCYTEVSINGGEPW